LVCVSYTSLSQATKSMAIIIVRKFFIGIAKNNNYVRLSSNNLHTIMTL
jgi:hypothetical protein